MNLELAITIQHETQNLRDLGEDSNLLLLQIYDICIHYCLVHFKREFYLLVFKI